MKLINSIAAFVLFTFPVLAQEKVTPSVDGNYYINILIVAFIIAAVLLLIFASVLLNTFKVLTKELLNPTALQPVLEVKPLEYEEWARLKTKKPGLINKLLGLKPIEEEKDMMLDHEFDGIRELNNPVPGWFNFLFYGSIAFGIMYFVTYHVTGWGMLQDEEYAVEMRQADADKKIYLARSANKIDENSVKINKEGPVLADGMAVYNANCVACHGDKGQGIVGPNLADNFWLHGGKINTIFKTIKYGVPEKGMMSWEKTLSPKQISEVSNYIISLQGTNPTNPKAPQGEEEEKEKEG
ncbi:MAG: c-type cytochrome [Flavobacterium sp.]|nr:c-type cytochrome [Pedobacter sp.]